MGRARRIDVGGYVYHALNRGNGRMTIFETDGDFAAFERVLEEAKEKVPGIDLISYCLMPNHWHLVLRPHEDGLLSRFVGWVTLTHTQRWHANHATAGGGHVYQSRFKSFLVDTDRYLVAVARYVERNALRAGLVKRAEDWKWSSLWRLSKGSESERALVGPWPSTSGRRPPNWKERVNEPQSSRELDAIRVSTRRGQPFGSTAWKSRMMGQFDLESTIRPRGRPPKRKQISNKGT